MDAFSVSSAIEKMETFFKFLEYIPIQKKKDLFIEFLGQF